MPAIPPPRASGFTTTTPVPLYWAEYGDPAAPAVLLLHGGPGASHDYLLPQMLELAHAHRVVTYDQRGGGRSRHDTDRGEIGWRDHVADLALVARERRISPLVVVGYSWGALLALLHATEAAGGRMPESPARLALVDPAPLNRRWRDAFEAEFARRQTSPVMAALRAELARSSLRERDPEAYRHRLFELSVAGYFADPQRARDLTPFRIVGRVQQSVWSSLGDYDLVPILPTVRVPALFFHGRQDPIPLDSSQAGARALGAECIVIEDCGHVPYVEQPDALFPPLLSFLRTPRPPLLPS